MRATCAADPRDVRDRLLQALAICDRLNRCIGASSGALLELVQPAADQLGGRMHIDRVRAPGVD